MTGVPFKIQGAFWSYEGLLRLEGDTLCFEFQAGLLFRQIKQVRVPCSELISVKFEQRWLKKSKLVFVASRLATFIDLPGSTQGRVELIINRKDRALAAAFVDALYEPSEGSGYRRSE